MLISGQCYCIWSDVEFFDFVEVCVQRCGLGLNAPVHMRFTVLIFNLVSCLDADKALDSNVFRKIISQSQRQWNLHGDSMVATCVILFTLKCRLVIPNNIKLIPTYFSVIVLNLLEKNSELSTELRLQAFGNFGAILLMEYTQIVFYVTSAPAGHCLPSDFACSGWSSIKTSMSIQ